jgi:hypothetical protein
MAAKFKSGELCMPKDAASNEDPAEPLHAYTGRKVLFLVSFVHIKFVACMLTLEKGSCFVLSVCVKFEIAILFKGSIFFRAQPLDLFSRSPHTFHYVYPCPSTIRATRCSSIHGPCMLPHET